MPSETEILDFITESNKIESIYRPPTDAEVMATKRFLSLNHVGIKDLERFVKACQPGAKLRLKVGMDVRVGAHIAPAGGPGIGYSLDNLLRRANDDEDPYIIHVEYETLHPFIDGNGRSGRVLWAWQMLRQEKWPELQYAFLRPFYYQALEHSDFRRKKE